MEAAKGHPAETCRSQLRDQANARRERVIVRVRQSGKVSVFSHRKETGWKRQAVIQLRRGGQAALGSRVKC
jgi:hypothetical protein